MSLFFFTAGGNLCQRQYKAPDNWKTSCDPLTNFYGRPSLWPVPLNLLSRNAGFPSYPKGRVAHLCRSHSVVSRRCTSITICNQSDNHVNCYLACNHWNSVRFSYLGLSRRECRELLCRKVPAKILRRVRESSSLTVTQKEDRALLRIMRRKSFLSVSMISVELNRRTGVGVTKPIFSVPLFSTFSVIVKTNVSYWISRSYLAGVAAA